MYQTKTLFTAKKKNQQLKIQPTEWEKVSANHLSDKELISRIYMELISQQLKN